MRTHIELYPVNWEWRDARQAGKRPVEGVGTNDADYVTQLRVNGKGLLCPAYRSWVGMLRRCYSKKFHQSSPSYVDATCHKPWLRFSNFRKWFFKHLEIVGSFGYEGPLQLDKDILSNSKTYGPKTCLLVTPSLNMLLVDQVNSRGDCPIGVTKCTGKFQAQVSLSGERQCRYGFETPEAAAAWRLQMKLDHVKNYPIPPWLDESIVRPRLIEIVRNQK